MLPKSFGPGNAPSAISNNRKFHSDHEQFQKMAPESETRRGSIVTWQ